MLNRSAFSRTTSVTSAAVTRTTSATSAAVTRTTPATLASTTSAPSLVESAFLALLSPFSAMSFGCSSTAIVGNISEPDPFSTEVLSVSVGKAVPTAPEAPEKERQPIALDAFLGEPSVLVVDDSGSMYPFQPSIIGFLRNYYNDEKVKKITLNGGRLPANGNGYKASGLTNLCSVLAAVAENATPDNWTVVSFISDGVHNETPDSVLLASIRANCELLRRSNCKICLYGAFLGSWGQYSNYISIFVIMIAILGQENVVMRLKYFKQGIPSAESLLCNSDGWTTLTARNLTVAIAIGANMTKSCFGSMPQVDEFVELYKKQLEYIETKERAATEVLAPTATLSDEMSRKELVIQEICAEFSRGAKAAPALEMSEFELFKSIYGKHISMDNLDAIISGKVPSKPIESAPEISRQWIAMLNGLNDEELFALYEVFLNDKTLFSALIGFDDPDSLHVMTTMNGCKSLFIGKMVFYLTDRNLVKTGAFMWCDSTAYNERAYNKLLKALIDTFGYSPRGDSKNFHLVGILLAEVRKNTSDKALFNGYMLERHDPILVDLFDKLYLRTLWKEASIPFTVSELVSNLYLDRNLPQGSSEQRTVLTAVNCQHGAHLPMCMIASLRSLPLHWNSDPSRKLDARNKVDAVIWLIAKFATKYSSSDSPFENWVINLEALKRRTHWTDSQIITKLRYIAKFVDAATTLSSSVLVRDIFNKDFDDKALSEIFSFHEVGDMKEAIDMVESLYTCLGWSKADLAAIKSKMVGLVFTGMRAKWDDNAYTNKEQTTGAVVQERFEKMHMDGLLHRTRQAHIMRIGANNPEIPDRNYFGGCRDCLFCGEKTLEANYHWHSSMGVQFGEPLHTLCFDWVLSRNGEVMSMANSIRHCLESGKDFLGNKLHSTEIEYYASPSGQEQLRELEAVNANFVKEYNAFGLSSASNVGRQNTPYSRFFMLTARVSKIEVHPIVDLK